MPHAIIALIFIVLWPVAVVAVLYPNGLIERTRTTEDVDDAIVVLYNADVIQWFGEYVLQTLENFAVDGKRAPSLHHSALTLCNIDDLDHYRKVSRFKKFSVLLVTDPWPHRKMENSALAHFAHDTNRLFVLWTEQMTRAFTRERFSSLASRYPRAHILHYSSTNKQLAVDLSANVQQVLAQNALICFTALVKRFSRSFLSFRW